jgi:predicted amino acid-binding ACT domain protein
MAFTVRRIDYFYTTVEDSPGVGYEVLSRLADLNVNLVAITAVPFGPARTQLTVFPDDTAKMKHVAEQANIPLDGPHPALVVQGDDEVGVLAGIHEKLLDANVHVFASTGVADGRGGYGYIIYVRPEEYERAAGALDV